MTNHKMNFTSEQLGSILQACEWAINDDYPMSDPINSHYMRIIKKIVKELKATEPENWNFDEDYLK